MSEVKKFCELANSLKNQDSIELFSNHMMKDYNYATDLDFNTAELTIIPERLKKKDYDDLTIYIKELIVNN